MSTSRRLFALGLALVCPLVACGTSGGSAVSAPVLEQAQAEATAIVQRAQATAMVLQAQAQATAVMAQAEAAASTATPAPTLVSRVSTDGLGAPQATPTARAADEPSGEEEPPASQIVEILRAGLAADGGLIIIQFRAPAKEAERWWQGSVSATDEESQVVYGEIPVMPKVGPLIARPRRDGGHGYVMLVNQSPRLQPGDRITVLLGKHRFEHVLVE